MGGFKTEDAIAFGHTNHTVAKLASLKNGLEMAAPDKRNKFMNADLNTWSSE